MATIAVAQRYSVTTADVEGHTTWHLQDARANAEVALAPDIGNFVYEYRFSGHDVVIRPDSLNGYLQKHWFCCGIPFLAPFANRIDGNAYYFGGRKFLLNDSLGNLLYTPDTRLPLHGLLVFEKRWQVVTHGASDRDGAFVTSRLEFYKYPELMAQFPFAHTITMTYRLRDGKLENTTVIENNGAEPMPVDIGFHPYFRPDGPRADWTLAINAKTHWIPDDHTRLIPIGENEPAEKYLPGARHLKLGATFIDDNFSDLDRDADGLAHLSVQGRTLKVEVVYGPEYDFAVVFAPMKPDLVLTCIEPQTGPTNAFNLHHAGKFPGLKILAPDNTFKATFWIVPSIERIAAGR